MSCEPIVNLPLLVELFPDRHPVSVRRWARKTGGGRGLRLPAPDLVVGGVDLWTVETILSWAADNKVKPDRVVLERVLVEQTTH